jgi:hypothetical protein
MRRRLVGIQAQFWISARETIIATASVNIASGDNMIARLCKVISLAIDDRLIWVLITRFGAEPLSFTPWHSGICHKPN